MKIIQMNELTSPESLSTLLRSMDYIAVELGEQDRVQTVCGLEMNPSGGYHLHKCSDVIGLFEIKTSQHHYFLVVGPGNDLRPFYSTKDEIRKSLLQLLSDAPLSHRIRRYIDGLDFWKCSSAFQFYPVSNIANTTQIAESVNNYSI
jgi:hypothetical protein